MASLVWRCLQPRSTVVIIITCLSFFFFLFYFLIFFTSNAIASRLSVFRFHGTIKNNVLNVWPKIVRSTTLPPVFTALRSDVILRVSRAEEYRETRVFYDVTRQCRFRPLRNLAPSSSIPTHLSPRPSENSKPSRRTRVFHDDFDFSKVRIKFVTSCKHNRSPEQRPRLKLSVLNPKVSPSRKNQPQSTLSFALSELPSCFF